MRPRAQLAGFTLIELLIVILIIGILVAIGVPAYLKYTAAANDRDAQAVLRTAYKAAVAGDTEVNSARFPVASTVVQDIQAGEPGISVARGSCPAGIGAASTKQVLVDPSSTTSQITMCTSSASGAIWKLSGPLTGNPTVSDASTVALTFSGNEITDAVRAANTQGDGQTTSSATGVWEATTNLAKNGGFESGVATWATTGGGVGWARDTSTSKFGAASVHMTVSAASPTSGLITGNGGTIPVSPNATYTLSAWIVGSGDLMLRASQFTAGDGSGSFLGDLTGGKIVATASWTRYSFTFTTGATTNGLALQVIEHTDGVANDVHFDGLQLEQKSFATPYVETNGATASRGSGLIRLPTSLVSPSQGWAAVRMRWEFPSSALGSFISPPRVFGWFQTGNDRLDLRFPNYSGQTAPSFVYCAAGSCASPNDPTNFSFVPGDLYTFVAYWTPSTLGVSVNGSVFYTTPNTVGAPAFTSALPEVGSYNGGTQIDSDILWFAYGTGPLTNADSATINGFGNNDPKRSSFPASTQATMVWDGTSATGSLK